MKNIKEKDKEIIAEWIKESFGTPDYDGYLGSATVPEDIMKVYRKKYPKDWETNGSPLTFIIGSFIFLAGVMSGLFSLLEIINSANLEEGTGFLICLILGIFGLIMMFWGKNDS